MEFLKVSVVSDYHSSLTIILSTNCCCYHNQQIMANFSYIPFAVIRTPIYPIDRLLSQMTDSEKNLDLFLSSPEFLELILPASPELYNETTRQLSKNGSLLPKTRSALLNTFQEHAPGVPLCIFSVLDNRSNRD